MKHLRISLVWLMVIAVIAALGSAPGLAQTLDKAVPKVEPKAAEEQPPADPSKPGYHHEVLKQFAGNWEVQGRMWFDPGEEPVMMRGSSVNEMIMEGLFLQSRFKGEMMGDVMVGLGFDGYDNARKKHVGVWMDSAGTAIHHMEGDYDADAKTITSFGTMADPQSGKIREVKALLTIKSSVMYTYQSWVKGDDGEWVKVMEIIFAKIEPKTGRPGGR